ncbi:hypothetical protein PMIN03_007372 [Paraphaeosphaeria minitans]
MNTPRFTKYTEDCRRVLEAAQDHPNEDFPVELVRLLKLVHRVDKVVYQDALDGSSEMTLPLARQDEAALATKWKPFVPVEAVPWSVTAQRSIRDFPTSNTGRGGRR